MLGKAKDNMTIAQEAGDRRRSALKASVAVLVKSGPFIRILPT